MQESGDAFRIRETVTGGANGTYELFHGPYANLPTARGMRTRLQRAARRAVAFTRHPAPVIERTYVVEKTTTTWVEVPEG